MRKYKSTQDTFTHTYRHTHTNTVLSLRMPTIRYAHAIQRYRYKRVSRDAAAMRRQLKGASVCSKRVLWGETKQRQSVEAGGGKASPKWLCTTGCRPMAARGRQKRKTTTGRPSERGVVDDTIEQRERERGSKREMEQEREQEKCREWGRESKGARGGESCICTARKY